jgi:nucleoside-diphosphate-sugar epimerase
VFDLERKRILITGASGFVGANLARYLLAYHADVYVFIRANSNLWRLEEILSQLKVYKVDITNRTELQVAIRKIQPHIIYHLAARRSSTSARDRLATLDGNIIGTFNLLETTALLNYHRLIHVGSSLEYGPKPKPLKESDTLEPNTFFGVTKASSTLLCQQFARDYDKPIVVLRLFSVYGYWEGPDRLIPTTIVKLFRKEVLPLTAPGYRRDLIFIEDIIHALICAGKRENSAGEIINVGSGKQWANEEVVEIIQQVSGKKINVLVGGYPARQSDTNHWVADNEKARKLLGWEPRHDLRAGLSKTIKWFDNHMEVYSHLLNTRRVYQE